MMADMDVDEGTMFANELMLMSDAEFKAYMADWEKKQQLAG